MDPRCNLEMINSQVLPTKIVRRITKSRRIMMPDSVGMVFLQSYRPNDVVP